MDGWAGERQGKATVTPLHSLQIRDYQDSDSRILAELFHASVHRIGNAAYSASELDAWAPTPIDYETWSARLRKTPPWVATLAGQVVGFITLEPDGHIHWTYVHPDYSRRGIASALYLHLEAAALRRRIPRLFVEASHLARPFFSRFGFRVVSRNEVERNDQILVNWRMEKKLTDPASGISGEPFCR